jgi:hypothetical protein
MQRQKRLQRLAVAQGKMVEILEAALVRKNTRASVLEGAIAEIDRLATIAGNAGTASTPVILRNLAARDLELKSVLEEAESLRQRLLSAKAREKIASCAFKQERVSAERKSVEMQAQEAACTVGPKASGKGRVVS